MVLFSSSVVVVSRVPKARRGGEMCRYKTA
jgi:hypothetical protein